MSDDEEELLRVTHSGPRRGIVDSRIIEDPMFTKNARLVYTAFTCHAGAGNTAIIRRKTLCEDLDMSTSALDRALSELRLAGILEAGERTGEDGSQLANEWRLNDSVTLPKAVAERAEARARRREEQRQRAHPLPAGGKGGVPTGGEGGFPPATRGPSQERGGGLPAGGDPKNSSFGEQQTPPPSGVGGRASASRPPGRGTRLAEDWQPTPALVARLRHLCPDVDQETEFLSFRAYWLSKAGKDATKVNWELCYEKWILEEQKKAGGRASSPAPRQSALARKVGVAQDLHARLAAREAAETQPTQGVIEGIVM